MTEKALIEDKEGLLETSLDDFLTILIDMPENREKRIRLVGAKSPLRKFLTMKLASKKKKTYCRRDDGIETDVKIATQMWHDMKTDPSFFKGFVFKKKSLPRKDESESGNSGQEKEKRLRIFSIRDIFKFSLTKNEVVDLFGISPWRFVAFHIFKECYPADSMSFGKLSLEMSHFDPRLVDMIMKSGGSSRLLSKKQSSILSEVLKGNAPEESLMMFKADFSDQMRNALCIETLSWIKLENTCLIKLIRAMSDVEITLESLEKMKLDSISVTITLLKDNELLDARIIVADCPLKRRCERIVEIFSKGKKAHHLSCIKCPQMIRAKSRLEKELLTRDQSNLHNEF